MKHINEFINEYFDFNAQVSEMLDDIDVEILCEAFQSNIFREIVDQVNALIKKDKEESKERGWRYYPRINNFKQIFGRESIAWDKITEDMIIEGSKSDETCVNNIKKEIRKITRDTSEYTGMLIILLNDDETAQEKKYVGIMIVNPWGGIDLHTLLSGNPVESFKVTKLDNYLTNKFLYINLTKELKTWDLERERSLAKQDVIYPGNETLYKEIAKKNIERYKKIIAKNHADADAKDNVPKKVEEYINKVMDIATKFSEDPAKYNSLEYDVQSLLNLIGDKKTYSWQGRRSSTYGQNGLIYIFTQYITKKLSISQGDAYSSEVSDYDEAKKAINAMCKKIDEKIAKIQEKIQALEAA